MRTEKLERYREERRKYLTKLDYIQTRIKELDGKIMECENLEIRALMKTENMTLADLLALVREMQEQRRTSLPGSAEDNAHAYDDDENAATYGYSNDEEETEPNDEI